MKKILLFAVAALAFSITTSLTAANSSTSSKPVYKYWTPFQLGFFPGVPSYVNNSRVIGIKTGWPISGGKNSQLDGFESSWIYSGTDYMNGLQASIFMNISKELRGFEPAIVFNFNRIKLTGIQASCLFNLAGDVIGIQAGGLNIAKSVIGFQPGVLGCITEDMKGFQAGLFTIAKKMKGFQASPLFNLMDENPGAFQLGLVNISTGKKGIQLGLINVIEGGKIPFMPFFNISL